jgi:hypothetical protein
VAVVVFPLTLMLLCAFAKLQKVTISLAMSLHLSAWNSSAPNGWIPMKFDTSRFLKISQEIQVLLKSEKSNRYFT